MNRNDLIVLVIIIIVGLFIFQFFLRNTYISSERKTYALYDFSKDFYEESFTDLPEKVINEDTEILGIIINHHLLASRLISRAFDNISYLNPKTVVLLSPNHFNIGFNNAISSEYDWQSHYGLLKNDTKMKEEMVDLELIFINEIPFPNEHGISNLVPYIKRTFPEAKFLPIILKEKVDNKDLKKIALYFAQFDPRDVLLIASLDFSHDSTSEIADIRDKISLEAIQSLDLERIDSIEVDSRSALTVLMYYATELKASSFNLLDNTNSAKLINNLSIEDATSYINGYFIKQF